MNVEELLQHAGRLRARSTDARKIVGVYAEICDFLQVHAGKQNPFLESVQAYNPKEVSDDYACQYIPKILDSYIEHIKVGLHKQLSPQRKAQIDVVSDFLEMSQSLLESAKVHPAAPAVIIGASLEEFLRTWVENESLTIGNKKPGLECYSQVLRESELITKQDGKDITSWAGIRNHAAHGEWEEVSDRARINLMLEGVNLFMRKYSS